MVDPNELLNKKFEKKRGGYKAEDVDSFMVEVASFLSQTRRETAEQKRRLDGAQAKIDEYEKDQKNLSEVLINAQRLADSIVRDARAKAEKIEQEATGKANNLIGEMRGEIVSEQEKLSQIKLEVTEFRSKLMSMYRAHLELINDMPVFHEEEPQEQPAVEEPAVEEPTAVNTVAAEPVATEQKAVPEPVKADVGEAAKAEEPDKAEKDITFSQIAAAQADAVPVGSRELNINHAAIETSDQQSVEPEEPDESMPEVKLNVRFDEESGEYVPLTSGSNKKYNFDSFQNKRR